MLLGRRRGRCPTGGRPAGTGPPRLQLRRHLRAAGGGALCPGPRRGPDPQPVHRVQPPSQVRPPGRAGPRSGLRRRGHRPPRPTYRDGGRALPAVPGGRPGQGPVLRVGHAGTGAVGPVPLPGGRDDQGPGPDGGAPPRPAHGGQARQPGRLLHPLGRGPLGIPGRSGRTPRGPVGRPCHRRGARRRRRRGAGDRGPTAGHGPQRRRAPPVRDGGGRAGASGDGRPARGGLRPRGDAAHRDLGRRRPHRRAGRTVGGPASRGRPPPSG